MSCLIITPEIRELAKKFPNETVQSVLNLVGLWQEKNNKSIEDIPLGSELNDFIKEIRKALPSKWARTAENGYEVSTRGDKRFSALVATFKKGTVIDGVDVFSGFLCKPFSRPFVSSKIIEEYLSSEKSDASSVCISAQAGVEFNNVMWLQLVQLDVANLGQDAL